MVSFQPKIAVYRRSNWNGETLQKVNILRSFKTIRSYYSLSLYLIFKHSCEAFSETMRFLYIYACVCVYICVRMYTYCFGHKDDLLNVTWFLFFDNILFLFYYINQELCTPRIILQRVRSSPVKISAHANNK